MTRWSLLFSAAANFPPLPSCVRATLLKESRPECIMTVAGQVHELGEFSFGAQQIGNKDL
jgi:hypothetical protein